MVTFVNIKHLDETDAREYYIRDNNGNNVFDERDDVQAYGTFYSLGGVGADKERSKEIDRLFGLKKIEGLKIKELARYIEDLRRVRVASRNGRVCGPDHVAVQAARDSALLAGIGKKDMTYDLDEKTTVLKSRCESSFSKYFNEHYEKMKTHASEGDFFNVLVDISILKRWGERAGMPADSVAERLGDVSFFKICNGDNETKCMEQFEVEAKRAQESFARGDEYSQIINVYLAHSFAYAAGMDSDFVVSVLGESGMIQVVSKYDGEPGEIEIDITENGG